jgi:tRNA(fMet)-specific endonuclease VapC
VIFLLDTDVLSNLIRRAPSPNLLARLATIPPRQQCTSSITLGELVYGAHRSGERRQALLGQIESRLLPNLPVYPFDASAARRYGSLRAELEECGLRLADADLRIAAIALANGLVLVTGNVRHFRRVPGLTVENWLA